MDVELGCHAAERAVFELRYESLFNRGRAYAFPCDRSGHVDLDTLSDRARENYLYVRALVGREFSTPDLCAATQTTTAPNAGDAGTARPGDR